MSRSSPYEEKLVTDKHTDRQTYRHTDEQTLLKV